MLGGISAGFPTSTAEYAEIAEEFLSANSAVSAVDV
jgi:hypothetical protein